MGRSKTLADLVSDLLRIALEGVIVATFLLVLIAFITFRRMNKDVRRARMFILADRFERFLASFTIAFLFLVAGLIASSAGFPLPASVSAVFVFVWLGGILYGALEIFFVIRPRPRKIHRATTRSPMIRMRAHEAPNEVSGDAPK